MRELTRSQYDPVLSLFILRMLRMGVPLGYTGPTDLRQECKNLTSADEFASFVTDAIQSEIGTGRQIGPYSSPPFPFYRTSPLGTVDKKQPLGSAPGRPKRRKIHHLSWPHGSSVNDHLERKAVALSRFDAFADLVRQAGKGALMSKLDVGAAYRNIPVRPADWSLLGFRWQHVYYWDCVLPFGCASSSLLYEVPALAATHIINTRVTRSKTDNYSDDAFQVTPAVLGIVLARLSLSQSISIMRDELGFPIPADKVEGPSTRITVLGLLIDSDSMEIRLDAKRLTQLTSLVSHWQSKATYTRKELQSLIGLLMFACTAIRPGRIFLHRMLTRLRAIHWQEREPARGGTGATNPDRTPISHSLTPGSDLQRDLSWWQHHLSTWNGTTLMYELQWTPASTLELETDACLLGYGARYGNLWFNGRWTDTDLSLAHRAERTSMPYLELTALVYAASTWGHMWTGRKITFHCDCNPVVQALTNHTSNLPETQQMERTLIHLAATHNFDYRVKHIAGTDNRIADSLSRFDMEAFHHFLPSASPSPTTLVVLATPRW